MSVIHQERGLTLDFRLLVYPGVVTLALTAFLVRLWDLQVVQSDELELRAERTRSTSVSLTAPRGLIVDRKGRPVAAVKSQYVVTGIPKILQKEPKILARVASVLGVPVEVLDDKLRDGIWRPNLPTPIFEGATSAQATRLVEDLGLDGVGVITQPTRTYVEPKMMTHVLGYVRGPDESDVARFRAKNMAAPEYVGKTGLELTHDFELSGQAGVEEMTVDSRNKPLRTLEMVNPQPGSKLVLGLDIELQKYAYELLGEKTGCVVAIEPYTGVILCFISKPSYDANIWLGGLTQAKYKALLNDPRKPLINRALQTGYAPGSTFKIVVALAAMLEGQLEPNRAVYCAGGYRLGKKMIKCLGHHGAISFQRAFEKSCNTYFISTGMRAGPEALRRAAEMLGLGQRTGIDLNSELKGIIPSEEWKTARAEGLMKRLMREKDLSPAQRKDKEARILQEKRWYPGDTANFSIGQGFVSVTPLQLAAMAAMVGNRGVMFRPHFVRELVNADGTTTKVMPEVTHRYDGPPQFWDILDGAMVSVVASGTAKSAQIPGLIWGGKTGSAENSRSRTSDSLFVGVAPMQNPRIAIAVVAENAGHGGSVAAPIAAKIVQRYLQGPPKGPEKDGSAKAVSSASRSSSGLPSR